MKRIGRILVAFALVLGLSPCPSLADDLSGGETIDATVQAGDADDAGAGETGDINGCEPVDNSEPVDGELGESPIDDNDDLDVPADIGVAPAPEDEGSEILEPENGSASDIADAEIEEQEEEL